MDLQPEKVRAVIFDFDGTLADSYEAIAASVNHVRGHRGLPPLEVAEVRRHVGHGPNYLLERTVNSDDVAADLALYRAHHPTVMFAQTQLLPGAAEALAAVRRTGRQAAVCSNKPRAFTRDLLAHLEIAPLVDVVIGPEDARRPKPAPEMLLLAMARLQLGPAEALYVGDMVVDIQTARSAGVPVWVVPTGSDAPEALLQAHPDRMLRDLRELSAWLTASKDREQEDRDLQP
jgi:phosphoglycolate phosphatase